MTKTLKEKVTLEPGNAYVVGTYEFWDHVIRMYESQVVTENDEWQEMADHVRVWVDATLYLESDEDN